MSHVIVIGGGINGAGIARDAAGRGFSVCLIEQADLCNATTRWSSRLIHGGLRYLEYAELGLVYECLRERETLLATAPHLVRALPIIIPIYAGGRRSRSEIAFGLWLYDLLASRKSGATHRMLGITQALQELPGLQGSGLLGAAAYHDAQVTFPERLVVENAIAARRAGAEIRTHTHVDAIAVRQGRVAGVICTDLRTGRQEMVEAPIVVNASGPWVDEVLGTATGHAAALLGRSRGSHIVVDPIPGQQGAAIYAEAASDGRPFFVIPWNGLTLIGTTDLPFAGDPGSVEATSAEIDYLLRETNRLWPGLHLERTSIHYAYAGVRPLMHAEGRKQGAVTRRHHIRHHREFARGLFSVIGGKLTTYRSLAEQVVDQLCRYARRDFLGCDTASRPLPGGARDLVEIEISLVKQGTVSTDTARRLVGLYGSRAEDVARLVRAQPALAAPLGGNTRAIAAEIIHGFQAEMATTVADCLLRRCMVGLDPDCGATAFEKALETARAHFDWDEQRAAAERGQYQREVAALRLPFLSAADATAA